METFSLWLALCEGNPPDTSGSPHKWPVTRSFDVFFHLRLNKRLSKQSRSRSFETPSHSLLCYCNEFQCGFIATWPSAWWRHQMETFSALLALCAGNSPVPGEFPTQRPVTRGFDVFFDLRLNKRLSKQSWGWWFETPSSPLWRHSNGKNQ